MSSIDSFQMPEYPAPQSERFETARLLMCRTAREDLDPLEPTLQNPDLARGLGLDKLGDSQAFIEYSVAAWVQGNCWTFTIVEKADGRVVGFARIDLRPRRSGGSQAEPTVGIDPDFQRRGYAYEAMRGLIAWTFNDIECPPGVTISEVRAACLPSNSASLGLLKKLAAVGMTNLGEQQVDSLSPDPDGNQTTTAHVFSVTREDYRQ